MTGSAIAHHAANPAAAMAATALADAVRRNLTVPGSVPPAEQFHLMLADRVANDQPALGIPSRAPFDGGAGPVRRRRHCQNHCCG